MRHGIIRARCLAGVSVLPFYIYYHFHHILNKPSVYKLLYTIRTGESRRKNGERCDYTAFAIDAATRTAGGACIATRSDVGARHNHNARELPRRPAGRRT